MPAGKERRVLIVGASGTIGSAVARELGSEGAVLGLHYCRNRVAVENLKRSIDARGARCLCLQSPLESEEHCKRLVREFEANFGSPPLSGVALCGGKVPWQPWEALTVSDWQQAFFEHCIAPLTVAREAALSMQQSGAGRIVFISSIAVKYGGSARTLHYAAAKGALEAGMHGLARLLAKTGVRINGVRSGFVDSPQQQAGRTPQEIAERIGKIPVGRPGTAEEIAAAFAYLMSDKADFITGEIITVAGGD